MVQYGHHIKGQFVMTAKLHKQKTVLYARVSTTEQTIDHQRTQAEKAGFVFTHVIADHGVSGVRTRLADRPQGKRLFDLLGAGDTLVVRWVDRLGRNYGDVTEVIRHFMDQGVLVKTVTNGLTFDGATTDAMQKAIRDAMIAFMAATAEAQAEATKEAQRAGIDHAQSLDDITKYRGRRPSFNGDQLEQVQSMLAQGAGVSAIASEVGVSRQTVYRIRDDAAAAVAMLERWEQKAPTAA
jgi:putative DNA-invertase from lambdoid prophage Rac